MTEPSVEHIHTSGRLSGTVRASACAPRVVREMVAGLLCVWGLGFMGCASQLPTATGDEFQSRRPTIIRNDQRSNVGTLKPDTALDPPPFSESIIRPGDQVQVMVWGYPEFNTTTTVKNYGTITLPLVGDVIAAGFTENQLARELKQRLSEYIKGDARINISHVSMNNRISVMGAVNKQGNYPALGDLSLIEVIADAGGTATDADLRHVKIIREGKLKNAEEVNLQRSLENGTFQNVPQVKPGDTVFVPTEENIVREIASYGQDVLVLFGFFALLR